MMKISAKNAVNLMLSYTLCSKKSCDHVFDDKFN